ncbi:unnamed protein product [Paramecium sonneborni]|uniref:G-protein coupled receptors family 1 profile domain-containing protein n=1 Tax=Paramecium sonneborni TaxID=65129 RepID=A0A8S1N6V6_9CILI|nr:unnamed protein product [Paramecium sonneborni]
MLTHLYFFDNMRVFAQRILFCLSISDFLYSLGLLLYVEPDLINYNKYRCTVQGIITQFATISAFLWSASIGYLLYISIMRGICSSFIYFYFTIVFRFLYSNTLKCACYLFNLFQQLKQIIRRKLQSQFVFKFIIVLLTFNFYSSNFNIFHNEIIFQNKKNQKSI